MKYVLGVIFILLSASVARSAEERVTAESMANAFRELGGKYLREILRLKRPGFEADFKKCDKMLSWVKTNEARSWDLDNPRFASNRDAEAAYLQGRLNALTQSLSQCQGDPV